MIFPTLAARLRQRVRASGKTTGFSLVEVVIALGIVSFALIAIVGLIPVGLSSLKDSVTDTTVSLLVTNVREAIVGQPFKAGPLPALYYDASARFLGQATNTDSYFRVDIALAQPYQSIPNSPLMIANVKVSWPVGSPENDGRTYRTSFFVTPVTGSGWQSIDTDFEPTIGL